MNSQHTNETLIQLLQQILAQNEALSGEIAALQAKVDLLEHKLDMIAEESGTI